MFTLNCNGRLLLIDKPIVMGIINTTPDSFFEDSRKSSVDVALQAASQMLANGATILDIGGQSTKPGNPQVSAQEETDRVVPIIQAIYKQFPTAYISIDTYYASVAKAAVEAGACIVNDVSGGLFDDTMLATVASLKLPYICMHMQGNSTTTMQQNPTYENVTREVLDFFIQQTEKCRLAGINDVIIDPGFGFGKTIAHNFQLMRELATLQMLNKPILAGISRKSTIYKTLGISAEEALNGTTVLNTICLLNGANILRVHDVKEAVEIVKLLEKYSA